jgi:TonB family protein
VPLEVEMSTPVITWSKPDPILCGTRLGSGQLCAAASVPGSFDYTPAAGEVLPAGRHKLSLTFTPADTENYTAVQATVLLDVEKATPAIAWKKPDAIPCGTPLDARQLRAAASVSGRFDYTPAPGEVLPAGTHKLSVTFTPADSRNYSTVQATVLLDVEKLTPVIAWSKPDSITCGTPLGAGQLCATASVAGTLVYTPTPGTVLPAGTHKLSVTFSPADGETYTTVQATVQLDVEKLTPLIAWSKPDSIPYSTPLGAGQLCAKASAAGTLVYTPGPGAVLPAGTHKLSVSFTPADRDNYTAAQATVSLEVAKSTPVIAWQKPDPIPYGTPLSVEQLRAAASVQGRFEYAPAPGKILPVGAHELSVIFTPADSQNYATAQATVSLEVEKSTPVVAWPTPDSIQYGTPLSTSQLCAAASVPGNFDYAPALGEVLGAGMHQLSATFVPADSSTCTPVRSTVSLEVTKAVPRIAWPAPHSIQSDTALGDAQLCASSPVPGTFNYTPGPGQVLPGGTHTLSVTFTPKDGANFATARATVSIKVLDKPASPGAWTNPAPKVEAGTHMFSGAVNPTDGAGYGSSRTTASPATEKPAYADKPLAPAEKPAAHIEWPTPQPMKHGKPLRAPEPEAAASTPGTFNDSPAQVKVPAPRVTPFPSGTEKYKTAQAKTEIQPEVSRDSSRLPATPSREENPEPVQKSGFASPRRQVDDKANEASTDIDWLNFHHEMLPEQDPPESKLGELWNSAKKKKWILVGVGGCSILLASGLAVMSFHSRAQAPMKGAAAPPQVVTEPQLDSEDPKPSPEEPVAQVETVPATQTVNAAQAQTQSAQTEPAQEQTDPAPTHAAPTTEQAEMMHNQLNAPSRISQELQKQQVASNAPPPSNFSAASASGLEGGSNIGNVFGGKAPSVVAAAPRGPLAISAGVAMGLLTQKTAPVYPEIAKKARVSGTVQLDATISKAGKVEDLHVLSGPIMLQGAALEAVRSWRYRPYFVNNQPTEVKTTIYVAFSLGE